MQEQQEFTLPVSQQKVVIRGYVTGKIDREIKALRAQANKMHFEVAADTVNQEQLNNLDPSAFPPGSKLVMETDPTAEISAEDKLLELMVVSLNGSNADVFNRLMELPDRDVDTVIEKIKAVQQTSEVTAGDPKAPTA